MCLAYRAHLQIWGSFLHIVKLRLANLLIITSIKTVVLIWSKCLTSGGNSVNMTSRERSSLILMVYKAGSGAHSSQPEVHMDTYCTHEYFEFIAVYARLGSKLLEVKNTARQASKSDWPGPFWLLDNYLCSQRSSLKCKLSVSTSVNSNKRQVNVSSCQLELT